MAQGPNTIAGTVVCKHEDGTQETMQVEPGSTLTMTSTGRVTWEVTAEPGETVSYARRGADGSPAPFPLKHLNGDIYSVAPVPLGYRPSFEWHNPDGTVTPLNWANDNANPQPGEVAEQGQNLVIPALNSGQPFARPVLAMGG